MFPEGSEGGRYFLFERGVLKKQVRHDLIG